MLLAFDIIRALIQLFPYPNGPLEKISGELFETLSSYFPIHFTHVCKPYPHYTCEFIIYLLKKNSKQAFPFWFAFVSLVSIQIMR